jgi:hypothetical protein
MSAKRKILVILSNRFSPAKKSRYVELQCDDEGNIQKEKPLRTQPRKPEYNEIWENDEGRTSFSSAYRMKRRYKHPLLKQPKP